MVEHDAGNFLIKSQVSSSMSYSLSHEIKNVEIENETWYSNLMPFPNNKHNLQCPVQILIPFLQNPNETTPKKIKGN